MMANGFPKDQVSVCFPVRQMEPPTCSPIYQKNLEINVIEDCVKKCRRLNSDQRKWWAQFIENERRYQNKWSAVTEDYLCETKGTGSIWTS